MTLQEELNVKEEESKKLGNEILELREKIRIENLNKVFTVDWIKNQRVTFYTVRNKLGNLMARLATYEEAPDDLKNLIRRYNVYKECMIGFDYNKNIVIETTIENVLDLVEFAKLRNLIVEILPEERLIANAVREFIK